MESGAPKKPIVVSDRFWESYNSVYEQGLDLFGYYKLASIRFVCVSFICFGEVKAPCR